MKWRRVLFRYDLDWHLSFLTKIFAQTYLTPQLLCFEIRAGKLAVIRVDGRTNIVFSAAGTWAAAHSFHMVDDEEIALFLVGGGRRGEGKKSQTHVIVPSQPRPGSAFDPWVREFEPLVFQADTLFSEQSCLWLAGAPTWVAIVPSHRAVIADSFDSLVPDMLIKY